MNSGIYSRLVEVHRLAAQLETKVEVISFVNLPPAIAAELHEAGPKLHAVKSRLFGAMLMAKEAVQKENAEAPP
jgi:hypothetical protein